MPPTLESGGAAPPPPPPPPTHTHTFLQMVFFLHTNARHSKPKVASRCRHAANIAFDLFNIFLYVIARKVQKCPMSPFVTSNVVLSCLVRMADILARLVQKADSLSALQLTGALSTINWGTLCQTHLPPFIPTPSLRPPPPTFWTASPPLSVDAHTICIRNLPSKTRLILPFYCCDHRVYYKIGHLHLCCISCLKVSCCFFLPFR